MHAAVCGYSVIYSNKMTPVMGVGGGGSLQQQVAGDNKY